MGLKLAHVRKTAPVCKKTWDMISSNLNKFRPIDFNSILHHTDKNTDSPTFVYMDFVWRSYESIKAPYALDIFFNLYTFFTVKKLPLYFSIAQISSPV